MPMGSSQSARKEPLLGAFSSACPTLSVGSEWRSEWSVTVAGMPGAWALSPKGAGLQPSPVFPPSSVGLGRPPPFLSPHLFFQHNAGPCTPSFSLPRAPRPDAPETPGANATSISRQPNISEARWAPGCGLSQYSRNREIALTYCIQRNCSSCKHAPSLAGRSVSRPHMPGGMIIKELYLELPSVAVLPPLQGNPGPSAHQMCFDPLSTPKQVLVAGGGRGRRSPVRDPLSTLVRACPPFTSHLPCLLCALTSPTREGHQLWAARESQAQIRALDLCSSYSSAFGQPVFPRP